MQDWILELRATGYAILYSTDLIALDTVVETEERSLGALGRGLKTIGLQLEHSGQVWLVTEAKSSPRPVREMAKDPLPANALIESTIVTGTRFNLPRDRAPYRATTIDARDMAALPALAGDALRIVTRLPGVSDVGMSARPHVRGGLQDETQFFLDGIELLEPFHLSDFQSLISTVDERAVASMDVYTGGFPARYGKRMSGVMDLSTVGPLPDFNTELSATLYTFGANTRGQWDGERAGEWFLSVRQGDLSELTRQINSSSGKPKFWDLMGRVGIDLSSDSLLSIGALATSDDAVLRDDEETANSVVDRLYLWSRYERLLGEKLHGVWTLSWIDSEHQKGEATLADIEEPDIAQTVGTLDYRQQVNRLAFTNDYRMRLSQSLLEFGVQSSWAEADYRQVRNFDRGILGDLLVLLCYKHKIILSSAARTPRQSCDERGGQFQAQRRDRVWYVTLAAQRRPAAGTRRVRQGFRREAFRAGFFLGRCSALQPGIHTRQYTDSRGGGSRASCALRIDPDRALA